MLKFYFKLGFVWQVGNDDDDDDDDGYNDNSDCLQKERMERSVGFRVFLSAGAYLLMLVITMLIPTTIKRIAEE